MELGSQTFCSNWLPHGTSRKQEKDRISRYRSTGKRTRRCGVGSKSWSVGDTSCVWSTGTQEGISGAKTASGGREKKSKISVDGCPVES